MKTIAILFFTLCILVTAACGINCREVAASAFPINDVVTITVRSKQFAVSQQQVAIGDITEMTGGTTRLRNQMAKLDLDVINDQQVVSVSQQQIKVRLMLAGFSSDQFRLLGPTTTRVRFGQEEVLRERVERAVASELARQFGFDQSDVQITLLNQPVLNEIRSGVDSSNFRATAVFSNRLPLGEKKIRTTFQDQQGNRISTVLSLRIVVMRNVIITSSSIPRGSVITATHVQSVKRPLSDSSIELVGHECIGCTATRDIPAHEIVSKRLVSHRKPKRTILVKRNDLVDIVLKRGPLNIRLKNAKALTSGAQGEVIQVLNTSSDKRLRGIVRDASTVVVSH